MWFYPFWISLQYRYFLEVKFFTDTISNICNLGAFAISLQYRYFLAENFFADIILDISN
jgi:hypothetical protein